MLNHDKYVLISEIGLYSRVLFLTFYFVFIFMQKLKSSEQIEEDILGVRSRISQWWDKCYYGKEQRTLCRPFFEGKLTLLYLDFPDKWIYKPK